MVKIFDTPITKYQASLYALAMGDAYGVGFEFMNAKEIKELYPLQLEHSIGGGPFEFLAGEFSDDTEMAVLTLASLQRKKAVDISHIKTLYTLWAHVAKDIGIQTESALLDGIINPKGEGNGALMRVLPAAAYMYEVLEMSVPQIKKAVLETSAITHDNDMVHEINDFFIDLMFDQPLEKYVKLIEAFSSTSGNDGWIMNTARIVYETLCQENLSLMDGFWKIISCGGDTDTACAIYGALRGYKEPSLVTQKLCDKLLSSESLKQLRDFNDTQLHWYEPDPKTQPRLFAGQYPGSSKRIFNVIKLSCIAELKVDSIFNLMEEKELERFTPYMKAIKALLPNLTIHSSPIRDMDIPTRQYMEVILDTMDHDINSEKNIYVHCWGGHGRTGTVVGSYLVRHGMNPYDALEQIKIQRRLTPFGDQPSPQTQEQIDFVFELVTDLTHPSAFVIQHKPFD